jgi:hypothetical protein
MITVRFSSENELIDELKQDYSSGDKLRPIPLSGERPILRISSFCKSDHILGRHYLIATMVNLRGELLRLDRYCGKWIEGEEGKAKEKVNEVLAKIQKVCDELVIDVRGGVIEPS